ncbi:MAG: 3-isopropylmalate dehydratase small subunit [Armatimonadetes bacterium]|nr:3-isopropylmalate dehydratase small subunit [Armatimonadota bacterium]
MSELRGRAHVYEDNVNTDVIIPARYLTTSDPDELAAHCMEDIDSEFVSKVQAGNFIVAGDNFGCGSSREHAPVAIKAAGISAVVAKSFARIFFRNAINVGLPALTCPEAAADIKDGDEISVDLAAGRIENITQGKTYQAEPFPAFLREIIAAGGLVPFTQKRLASA